MIYRYVIAIAVKIIPYSVILGFLFPYFSGILLTYALAVSFVLAFVTSITDFFLAPVLLTPNLKHQNGMLVSAIFDIAITYFILYSSQSFTTLTYSIPGFLLISILIGITEIVLHMVFNWALSPRVGIK
jgi:hypothetical protein